VVLGSESSIPHFGLTLLTSSYTLHSEAMTAGLQHQGMGDSQAPCFRDQDSPVVLWSDFTTEASSQRFCATYRFDQTLLS
jgi:hypothetical protein